MKSNSPAWPIAGRVTAAAAATARGRSATKAPSNSVTTRAREDPLRLAILPAGDGRASRSCFRTRPALGACRARRFDLDGIPKSSNRGRAARMACPPPPPHIPRGDGRNNYLPHLAVAAAQSQSTRTNAQLYVVLCLSRSSRSHASETRCDHRVVTAIVGWTLGMVARVCEKSSARVRSAGPLARIASCRRRRP